MNLTKEQLKACMPHATKANIDKYYDKLVQAMDHFNINTPKRIAAFIAQIGHESLNLSHNVENLNYSASGLLSVFPKYFNSATAKVYARNPQKIANRVYANRYGNGNEESGDGWRYRGRGLIMTTFFDNYKKTGIALDYDFISNPDDMCLPGAASFSAAYFWKSRGLNELADKNNFNLISRRINGGDNGLVDRIRRWQTCKSALGVIE